MARSEAGAWMWSGVATTTASISFCISSSILRIAEIAVVLRPGVSLAGIRRAVVVDVAEADDVLVGQVFEAEGGLAAGADEGDVELLAGRRFSAARDPFQGKPRGSRERRLPQCLATGERSAHRDLLSWLDPI